MNIYPGCNAMTFNDARRMDALNRKNGWGLSMKQLVMAVSAHKHARETGDIRRMEMIEYRLTDINFHTECAMLNAGEYDELREKINREWRCA